MPQQRSTRQIVARHIYESIHVPALNAVNNLVNLHMSTAACNTT